MAVKLHRCKNMWAKFGTHPCWKVQKALDERASTTKSCPGRGRAGKDRTAVIAGTGQPLYPAIEFEDGSWYREQSKDMVRTIREGKLMERRGGSATA